MRISAGRFNRGSGGECIGYQEILGTFVNFIQLLRAGSSRLFGPRTVVICDMLCGGNWGGGGCFSAHAATAVAFERCLESVAAHL